MNKDSTTRWLDIHGGFNYTGTMEDLYRYYINREHRLSPSVFAISFDDIIVKVPDLNGWTNLEYIRKEVCERWYRITVLDSTFVLGENEFIPVYYPEFAKEGFHGEIKYPYILKNAPKILDTDKVRLIRDKDDIFEVPKIERLEDCVMYQYRLNTKSRFVNIAGIHKHACGDITTDEWIDFTTNDCHNIKCYK